MAKKIIAIISLSLIGILVVATIVLANIPFSHNFKHNKPDYIEVYYGGTETTARSATNDDFNKIIELINKATDDKILNALFEGRLNDKPVLVDENEKLTSVPSNASSYYVCYKYKEGNPQTLMDGDKAFKDENGNEYLYAQICFEITEKSETIKAYVIPQKDDNGNNYRPNNGSKLQYHKYYSINADFSELYTYLSDAGFKR